ncbi:M14 family zinc carboxypeptidase [Spongisporangium articulatum]|uniref:M14 family zinc carboxypeptidase n=1 Tax=Spongisporangium articulatum TaxID=3362603 RepID=A0ABW8AM87_9ACTN
MTRSRLMRAVIALVAVVGMAVLAATLVPDATAVASAKQAPVLVLRVHAPTAKAFKALRKNYDLLEKRSGDDYFVLGDAAVQKSLKAKGYRVSVADTLAPLSPAPTSTLRAAATYATFYGGYHTAAAQQQHLRDVAATYPTLATVVDYGDSWLKTKNRGGNDLLAICITKKNAGDCALNPNVPKPRSVLYAAIHARELATAEIAWNWIDYLTQGYGTNAAVTSLLDTTELWVIPVANPDGRQIVESGGNSPYYQRKNADDARGNCRRPPTSSNQYGVDMNRNATFHWGGVGSTNTACAQEYRGTSAASEPETAAQQALFNNLFKDQRGPNITDAAPATATGTFISYHSYASLTLYPWGDTTNAAPNKTKLKALADRMVAASGSGYTTGQGPSILYGTSGTTDDDMYGRLGVASFTTELGAANTSCDGFMPPYSCVGSRFWPQEQKALMVLAQAAAGPYR